MDLKGKAARQETSINGDLVLERGWLSLIEGHISLVGGNIVMVGGAIVGARLENAPSHPRKPYPGQTYFNMTDKAFYGYNGTDWRRLDL